MSVTADHDPLLGLPLTPTKRQTFQDCWIKQIAINKLNTKLKVVKCQNGRVARNIILKDEGHDQNSQIHVG